MSCLDHRGQRAAAGARGDGRLACLQPPPPASSSPGAEPSCPFLPAPDPPQLIGWGMIQTGTRLTIGADGNTVPISVGGAAAE